MKHLPWRQVLQRTWARFGEIDGTQRAAAFSYYVFLSVFPLLVLFVTLGSLFVDRDTATANIIGFINDFLPLPETQQDVVFKTVRGVIEGRTGAGLFATLLLFWSAMKFLKILIRATNRAWQLDTYQWWRLPLKSAALMGIVAAGFVVGIAGPIVARITQTWLAGTGVALGWLFDAGLVVAPLLVLFFGLAMVYKLAPNRSTAFSEVWLAALGTALLFRLAEAIFVLYLSHFSNFNALYGTLGGIIAFLMWIYLSGILYVAGACFCAAQAETLKERTEQENQQSD